MAGRLYVISSPSGGGKTTVVDALCKKLPFLRRSISATTRRPRAGEIDGRDYCFVTRSEFEALAEKGALLEWAEVHGELYGTPREPIEAALAKDEIMVLCIDVQGARSVRERLGRAAELIFIMPPSLEALEERLQRRATESEAALQQRLVTAREEIAQAPCYDHRVVNDRLDEAVEQIAAIIQAQPDSMAA